MKVLITGATGFLGSWVARELVAAGHEVRALVRTTSSLANLAGLPVERAEGDVLDPASVRRALAGREAVVHTAGVAHFLPGDTERMYAVNVRGVEIVLGAALEAGVSRAVLTSSTAAMGGTFAPRVADETTPSNAESLGIDYFISKLRGERAALALAARGLDVCAVRPVVALGPGDIYRSSATTFLALARRKIPVYVRGGASFTDARDIARGHVAALERGRRGEVYILGGHNLEIERMLGIVSRVTGVAPPMRVPYPAAYLAAGAIELGTRAIGRTPDLSRQLVKASRLYTFVSSARAEQELGYTFRPFEESLRDTLRFFMREGRLQPATPELRAIAAEAGSA
jgi:dihydroflavonol-4-reductase